jgi:hypothetical protein
LSQFREFNEFGEFGEFGELRYSVTPSGVIPDR